MKKQNREEMFIDLASTIAEAKKANVIYVCPDCSNDLILDTTFSMKNPFAGGDGYWCMNCQNTFDSSLVRLAKKPKPVTSTIGDTNNNNNNQDFLFEHIPEQSGFDYSSEGYDPYTANDPEESGDEQLEQQGFHIVDSRIELTDSNGRNRIVAKRIK